MIDKQFEVYRSNVLPVMLEDIAKELEIPSVEPLIQLGIGYCPAERSWVFPERDTHGHVIGMLRRFPNGRKLMVKGSRRGFTYAPTTTYEKGPKRYISGAHNWTRVSKDIPCPICEKSDWCLISSKDIHNPNAVICARIQHEAKMEVGESGFLHILRTEGNIESSNGILAPTEYPYLIVEGASDWTIGTYLGFTTIGKPHANHACVELIPLLAGKDVIILGENDGGPGEKGTNRTFEGIKKNCNAVKLLPPEGIKDLREWFSQCDITRIHIMDAVSQRGQSASHEGMLEDISPLNLAREWLSAQTINGIMTVGSFNRQWIRYQDGKYVKWPDHEVRGHIYKYFDGMEYSRMGPKNMPMIDSLTLTRAKVSDIMDALNADCPISHDPPIWLDGKTTPDPLDLIVFKNGILDINQYFEGEACLISPTPALFTFNSIPHEFHPDAQCEITKKILWDILSGDQYKMDLLQEWLGYNLIADQSMEKLMLFVGRRRSGKSTILEVMKAMLGEGQCASTSFAKLTSNFGCQPLIGKLAALMSDASVPRNIDATHAVEKIKQITGGDSIGINRKFLPEIPSITLNCRFTIAVNTLPELPDHANALIPRLNLLRFEESYEGHEDRTIKRKLIQPKESEGVLVWALEGLKRLKESGEFTISDASTPLMKQFKALSSPITEFIMECCEVKDGELISKAQLYDTWKNWAIASGQRPGTHAQLNQQLLSLYPSLRFIERTINKSRLKYIRGIDITEQARETYL